MLQLQNWSSSLSLTFIHTLTYLHSHKPYQFLPVRREFDYLLIIIAPKMIYNVIIDEGIFTASI